MPGPAWHYRAEFWRLWVGLARGLPRTVLEGLAPLAARIYWLAAPGRRRVVQENVLPALDGDAAAARRVARELFQQFALKLVDLWRYESGRPVDDLFHGPADGWEHFQAARARGRGVLLVTVHLGNWEFGAPLLTRHGVKLLVVTAPEPHARLTTMRQAARARWGVETIAVGEHPFAGVEILRRLEANDTVALLVDRPPAVTAVMVDLFGRPFAASISAAELARASGCAVLPVVLPRVDGGYRAHVLPEVAYDRRALGDRAARIEFTRQILHAFAPAVKTYLNQWYHFVPLWPAL